VDHRRHRDTQTLEIYWFENQLEHHASLETLPQMDARVCGVRPCILPQYSVFCPREGKEIKGDISKSSYRKFSELV
jgi:hypothetical protein